MSCAAVPLFAFVTALQPPAGRDLDEVQAVAVPPAASQDAAPIAARPLPTVEADHVAAPPSAEAIGRQTRVLDRAALPRQSPQRFAVEFKAGPYLPKIDEAHSGPGLGPYATVFGKTNSRGEATAPPRDAFMPAISFEWQFVHLGGPLSIGVQAAWMRHRASALVTDPVPGGDLRSEADKTSFSLVPMAALVGYRFEWLADRLNVPLVPYARFGAAYAVWWVRGADGDLARSRQERRKARGGTWGWQANLGGMLRLDFIERGTAQRMDQELGVNHSYLFGEYQIARIDGFGGDALNVGADTWLAGLAFEF